MIKIEIMLCETCAKGATDAKISNISKNALKIEMKFIVETVEEVAQAAIEHIVHYNLSPMMVQCWSHAQELNGYLIELVYLLALGYRVANSQLNPLALDPVHQLNYVEENMQDN